MGLVGPLPLSTRTHTQHEEGHAVGHIVCRVFGLARACQCHHLQLALQAVGDDCRGGGGRRGTGKAVRLEDCGRTLHNTC